MPRVERILNELRARYGNDERFTERLRPMLKRIVDPSVSDESQVSLLELAAETCERDSQIKRDGEAARAAWDEYIQILLRLVRGGGDPPARAEGA